MPRSARLRRLPPPRSKYPSDRCRSLWQTPAARTFNRTSLPVGCGVGCSLSCRGWPQTQTWNIRIGRPPVFFVFREAANHSPQPASLAGRSLDAFQLQVDRRPVPDRLINDAVALGKLEELVELFLRRIGIEIEAQPDLGKADRRILGDAERAAEVEIAFGRNFS